MQLNNVERRYGLLAHWEQHAVVRVEWRELIVVAEMLLLVLLTTNTMRILLAQRYDCVGSNENSQEGCEHCLQDEQNQAHNSFGRLCEPKFFDEDQDADDGNDADDLDEDLNVVKSATVSNGHHRCLCLLHLR